MPLVPAKAGTSALAKNWIPAFAVMSGERGERPRTARRKRGGSIGGRRVAA
jgi:hypothetical protein